MIKTKKTRWRVIWLTILVFVLYLVWNGFRLGNISKRPASIDLSSPKNLSCVSCFQPKSKPLIADETSCPRRKVKSPSPSILVFVLSTISHFEQRQAIRETWGNRSDDLLRIIFVLGQEADEESNLKVKEEHDLYGDIYQDSAMEQYRTVTRKMISSLKWIADHCAHYDYLVKLDDDVYLNRDKLFNYVSRLPYSSSISCHLCRNCPVLREGKWFVSHDLYPYDYYPDYCYGPFYALSFSNLFKIVHNIENVPYFDIEDVYLTGLVAEKANIRRVHLPSVVNVRNYLSSDITYFSPCLFKNHVVASHGYSPAQLRRVWRRIKDSSCPQPWTKNDTEAIEREGRCRSLCWMFDGLNFVKSTLRRTIAG